MAFHTTKAVVKIDVVRNEMGDHQRRVSGLDFKFQITAPEHLNHNKHLKKKQAATDPYRSSSSAGCLQHSLGL